ncbi:hypothetical protein M1293_03520 [Candidatus Parvarchaeota archaeon]|nr:hypothetical protein [Candidatus Parvarchaeota archaeon]
MEYDYGSLFTEAVRSEAKGFALSCVNGSRWYSNPLLIAMDACFDSSGLGYFSVVFRKVNLFYEKYVKTGIIKDMESFIRKYNEIDRDSIFMNNRVWSALKDICAYVVSKKKQGHTEMQTLKEWARNAKIESWREDSIGMIKGVGLITFQYLRMQVGENVVMPDKVILNWVVKTLKRKVDAFGCMKAVDGLSRRWGISNIELCWAIWIQESGELGKIDI